MFKAYKYRIYPTKEQEKTLNGWIGQMRFVWNLFLQQNIDEYNLNKKFIFKVELSRKLPDLKKKNIWLNAPAVSYQYITEQLDKALKLNFKSRNIKFGFPKFKKKNVKEQGIRINQQDSGIKLFEKQIQIPKMGRVKIRKHREIPDNAKLKAITITRDVDQWYVSCLLDIDQEINQKEIKEETSIGIDLGIKSLAVTSNNEIFANPKFLTKIEKKLAKEQRKLSKKKLRSNNRNKQRIKVAKIHRKIRFQRKNQLHQISSSIAKNYNHVFAEDLSIKNMMKNRCLSKAIGQIGWYQFITYLSYKTSVIKIDRYDASSQICSGCGARQKMPLHIRTYNCPNCGLVLDRDLNAAINIKQIGLHRAGIAQMGKDLFLTNACGDISIREHFIRSRFVSEKQETIVLSVSQSEFKGSTPLLATIKF
jgi:putative transposase